MYKIFKQCIKTQYQMIIFESIHALIYRVGYIYKCRNIYININLYKYINKKRP